MQQYLSHTDDKGKQYFSILNEKRKNFCSTVIFFVSLQNNDNSEPSTLRRKAGRHTRTADHLRHAAPKIRGADARGMGSAAFRALPHRRKRLSADAVGQRGEPEGRREETAGRHRALRPRFAPSDDCRIQGSDGRAHAEGVRASRDLQPATARRFSRGFQRSGALLLPNGLRARKL